MIRLSGGATWRQVTWVVTAEAARVVVDGAVLGGGIAFLAPRSFDRSVKGARWRDSGQFDVAPAGPARRAAPGRHGWDQRR
ncbi:hypothetical protein [Micromonospora sp. KC723]|uniref:hypothetical protein n=1 Tax=Micromonospora sp. KC723 TaxID=2530381 RepID=UPI0010460625|nr:hypothetical protein [Micromonospora sp. KC723]TDB71512.1 hypothetical protein E1165_22790 [Micromonospora sp. KC723]